MLALEEIASSIRIFAPILVPGPGAAKILISGDGRWVKASASDPNGNCAEIRDTKDHGERPTLILAPRAITTWLEGAPRRGEFAHLANR
ncbi:DUF397 domain-containing protein [Kineosporia sp. NBRC 101731]|uniref:DUF397 domain-containing protein n=1 Tax=Kineosporia sp. NBRC 101731 TaxID=3032199 RepID=UPI0024A04FFA|nr:hypothetical protein Kisp02_66080 [Kineosporia sp. NBRC 101731]